MHSSTPVVCISWRVRAATGAALLALLVAIGAMQAGQPVAAQEHITQAPTLPGSRNLTQSPRIGTAFYDAPRDRPDPIYIATSTHTVGTSRDRPDPVFIATATRTTGASVDRPDPIYIPTLPR